jgi:23S rRNA (cytosine1962-C5)-methyltransferase
MPQVTISSRGARRIRQGHVWVYKSDVRNRGQVQDGDVVRVLCKHRSGGLNPVGVAFYNSKSVITLRFISRQDIEPDRVFFEQRIKAALDFRARVVSKDDTASRLVYSEADALPGLIVDRYDDVLVLQTLCAGSHRLLDTWVDILFEQLSPRAMIERNDTRSRHLEGLPESKGVLVGHHDGPLEISEGGLRFLVDPLEGQKTGYFLDQRENHARAGVYARGRCLDVFSYHGGFGLSLAAGGADSVLLVDQSKPSLEGALAAARLNRLNVTTLTANAFDFLREQQSQGQRYDVIVLDPPAFVKNKDALESAIRGYKEINLRAMKLLEPGGVLITSSCSYHMCEALFEETLQAAASDAGRSLQILERRSQSRDHPERLGFPESRYLKCFVLRAL